MYVSCFTEKVKWLDIIGNHYDNAILRGGGGGGTYTWGGGGGGSCFRIFTTGIGIILGSGNKICVCFFNTTILTQNTRLVKLLIWN